MKWHQFYNGLTIRDQKDQPDCDIDNYFQRMAEGAVFVLRTLHLYRVKGEESRYIYGPQNVQVKVLKVEPHPKFEDLLITCKFIGVQPDGFNQGVHVLHFSGESMSCYSLPESLFKDEKVPKDELSDWDKSGN